MAKSSKGASFERWFCEQLSLWFSKGESEDWFWRTAGSGARATTRKKSGKRTKGHYGDIAATCSEGEAFTRSVLLELKRGYNKVSLQDLLDTRKKAKASPLDEWLSKLVGCAEGAGIPHWMLVFRRDRRDPIVMMPSKLANNCLKRTTSLAFHPWGTLMVQLSKGSANRVVSLYVMTLTCFFHSADPGHFK